MNSHERAADKTCTRCNETKPEDRFSSRQSWCKDCINEYSRQHYQKNKKKVLKQKRTYRASHKDRISELSKQYRKDNAERLSEYMKVYREENRERLLRQKREDYRKNRAKYLQRKKSPEYNKRLIEKRRKKRRSDPLEMARHNFSRALRRKAEKQATPAWCDLKAVMEVYEEAQRLTDETGIKYSVDHIYPLQGKAVCGLHVPENLQVIPLTENCAKQNKVLSDEIV